MPAPDTPLVATTPFANATNSASATSSSTASAPAPASALVIAVRLVERPSATAAAEASSFRRCPDTEPANAATVKTPPNNASEVRITTDPTQLRSVETSDMTGQSTSSLRTLRWALEVAPLVEITLVRRPPARACGRATTGHRGEHGPCTRRCRRPVLIHGRSGRGTGGWFALGRVDAAHHRPVGAHDGRPHLHRRVDRGCNGCDRADVSSVRPHTGSAVGGDDMIQSHEVSEHRLAKAIENVGLGDAEDLGGIPVRATAEHDDCHSSSTGRHRTLVRRTPGDLQHARRDQLDAVRRIPMIESRLSVPEDLERTRGDHLGVVGAPDEQGTAVHRAAVQVEQRSEFAPAPLPRSAGHGPAQSTNNRVLSGHGTPRRVETHRGRRAPSAVSRIPLTRAIQTSNSIERETIGLDLTDVSTPGGGGSIRR